MICDDNIKDEKLQYIINSQPAKISTLSSGKIDRYEYPTYEEILLYKQSQIIEKDKFTNAVLGKALKK